LAGSRSAVGSAKELAAAVLDRLIRRLPAGPWDQTETWKIAARLIELLPRRDAVAWPDEAKSGRHKKANPSAVIWLIVLALGTAALFGALANRAQRSDDHGASTAIANGLWSPAQP
jgi:hypothetical protein